MKQRTAAVVALLVAAVIAANAAGAEASTVTIKLPTLETPAEKEFDVPIEVSRCRGLGGIQFVLSFDPQVLELLEVQTGSLPSGGSADVRKRVPGKARIAMIADSVVDGDGQLLVARFKAIGKSGQSTALEIEETKAVTFKDRVDMLVTIEPGNLQITAAGATLLAANNSLLWIVIGLGSVIVLLLLVMVLRRKAVA